MKVAAENSRQIKLPLNGKITITSRFGYREFNNQNEFHKGVDLVSDDKLIRSSTSGKVIYSTIITDYSNDTWQWGNFICIFDGCDYFYYCHLLERFVDVGETVKQGDIIGIMGNTGYSSGQHLHFEIRTRDGISVNPFIILGINEVYNNVGTVLYESWNENDDDMDKKIKELKTELWQYQNKLPQSNWSKKDGGFDKATKLKILDGTNPQGIVTREMLAKVLNSLGLLD